jgi:hypothetical protein
VHLEGKVAVITGAGGGSIINTASFVASLGRATPRPRS